LVAIAFSFAGGLNARMMLWIWLIVAVVFIAVSLAYAARETTEDQLVIVPGAIVIGLLWPLALVVIVISMVGGIMATRSWRVKRP
jgi:hypothetical protein